MSVMNDSAISTPEYALSHTVQSATPERIRIGLDIGSTTVKAVVLATGDALEDALFADYRRHHANVRATVSELITDIHTQLAKQQLDQVPIDIAITGSGGLGLADGLHVPFIQEVIAETKAITLRYPQADVIVELGGEDAKVTYIKPTPEQRMNGSCAGGTGAFIDQMATLLDTDPSGLDELSQHYNTLYPIASRCGVFAKSDLQPLINDGAEKADLAASIFTAVATQTIAGLSSGRPIRGNVVFLGGPLFFLSGLRAAFARALDGKVDTFILPEQAHLYVAYGAALMAQQEDEALQAEVGATTTRVFADRTCDDLLHDLRTLAHMPSNTPTMPPLFANDEERAAFRERHGANHVTIGSLEGATGPHYLGIDAGSTTIKATLINDDRDIVWSSYATNEGSPLTAAISIVQDIRKQLPEEAYIARSCATGYGEGLIATGLHLDEGVVETMAHFRGASLISPGVTSIIDIGGQDMKYLSIADGVIDSIAVNEACSSGCGSFLQTFAQSMGLSIEAFTQAALRSTAPVDLGSRCTVFMNSSVKQAQKEGASLEDIAAGLCYAVVRNALYKVIKLRDAGELGDTVIVQGGTFLNDAVLRAFELLTGLQVVRPSIAGLMGAYGAALTARMHYEDGMRSTLLDAQSLAKLTMSTSRDVCKLCQNHCKLTITTFADGTRHVTGNRCERGGDASKERSSRPNLYEYKYKRCFGYRRLTDKKATRGAIGIPRVLNMYENYPFWFTLLTSLGFKVVISGRSSHELFETGIDSIASENICYPAKLVHGHIQWLLDKGITTIFYPCVSYEQHLREEEDNHYNCPVVANYPIVIGANMTALRAPGIRFMHPYVNLADRELMVQRIVEEFAWAKVSEEEARVAVQAAYGEDALFRHDVRQEGLRALAYMKEHDCKGIVLAGRPYHVDPEINHGIPETICALGMVVLSEDAICDISAQEAMHPSEFLSQGEEDPKRKDAAGFRHVDDRVVTHLMDVPLRVTNQWAYHSRLYAAAHTVSQVPGLELVQLNSFGCGLDAITTDQVAEILADKADVYTMLKIDEVSNLGAAKIRLRSLQAAIEERESKSHAEHVVQEQSPDCEAEHEPLVHAAPRPVSHGFRSPGSVAPTAGRQAMLDAVMGDKQHTAQAVGQHAQHHPGHQVASLSKYAHKTPYTKRMRKDYTIVAPQMSPIHFSLVESVIRASGYKFDVLKVASHDDMQVGLKYVNNDACFPAIVVIGQLIDAIEQGKYDPDHTALAITQTGGMCRATNYFGLIRKALIDAGYPQIPVIAISTQGLEDNPGFNATPLMIHRAVKALIIGDLLMKCLYRVRPYEARSGSANALYETWNTVVRETIEHHGYSHTAKQRFGIGYLPYPTLVQRIVSSFDQLPLKAGKRKPRVGVVGEILVKYHPDANNHLVDVIESQGCEAVVPGIMEFMTTRPYIDDWNRHYVGKGGNKASYAAMRWALDRYYAPVRKALSASKRFTVDAPMPKLVQMASEVTSIGVQAGEGWLLTAEILELIEQGCPNVVCAQPFACLPNHVTGRGMFGEIRRQHPEANIVSIDYDPGASEANQLNRLKLMIATAKEHV